MKKRLDLGEMIDHSIDGVDFARNYTQDIWYDKGYDDGYMDAQDDMVNHIIEIDENFLFLMRKIEEIEKKVENFHKNIKNNEKSTEKIKELEKQLGLSLKIINEQDKSIVPLNEKLPIKFIPECEENNISRDVEIQNVRRDLLNLKYGNLRDKYLMALYMLEN